MSPGTPRTNDMRTASLKQLLLRLAEAGGLILCKSHRLYFFCWPFSIFAQVSRSVTARLKTSLPGAESLLSTQK